MALLDTVKGIFSGDDKPQQEQINTPEQEKIVQMVMNDYPTFKTARQRYEGIWRQEQRFYKGDHWFGLRPEEVSKMRPNSVDNVAWSQIEAIVSKLAGWMPYPDFEAQEETDDTKAADLNDFMPYELRCIKFKHKHIRAVRRMVIHGPLIYQVAFDPTIEGGYGQNRYIGNNDIIPVDLGSFFPDPRIKDFISLQKGGAHIVYTMHPLEYFVERWGKQGAKVKANHDTDADIFDQDDYTQKGFSSDRAYHDGDTEQQRGGLIQYWYRDKPKLMTKEDKELFTELAQEKLMEGKDPSECYAKAKGTMKGVHCISISRDGVFLEHKSYVYDHGFYPFVARTLFPDEDNPYGKGYMRDIMPPQIMLNKFAEIAVETMAKQGNSAIVYEEDAITKPEVWKRQRSIPAAMLPISDISKFKELQGVDVPQTVFNMLEYYKDMLQKIPGQFDSANGQANPNVTSGEQAKALISASSQRLGLASETIQDALEEVFMQYIELMAQFYTVERVGRVTGKKAAMSRDRLINTAPTQYETGNMVPNPLTGTEEPETTDVYEEYVPKFDIYVNIGVERPKDREYAIQTAFNLFGMIDPATQMPFIDAEAVKYAVENGRLEPFSSIEQRMQKEQQIMQELQRLQEENQLLQAQVEETTNQIVTLEQSNLKSENQNKQLALQQDDKEFDRMATMRKLEIDEMNAMNKFTGNRR
jgi:hypothetical protein